MFEDGDFLFLSNFVKVVHVKLTDERRKLFMLEVFGEYFILKEVLVLHDEAGPIVCPLYYVPVLLLFQNLVGLHYKIRNLLLPVHSLAPGPFRPRLLLATFLHLDAVGLVFVGVSF